MNKFCLFTFLLGTLWVSAQTELTDEQKWELWKLSYMNLDSARGALKTIDSTSAFYSDLSQHIQFESGIVPSQIKSNSTSSNTLLRGSFFVYHDEFDSAHIAYNSYNCKKGPICQIIYSEKLYTTFYHRKKIGSRDYIRQIDSLIDLSSPFVKPFLMERKARVYYAKQENVEAYELLIEASKIADSVGQNFQNIKILLGLSAISKRMESFNDAKNFALSAIKLAKSMGFGRLHKASLRQLSNSYLALGDFENAEIIIKDLIQKHKFDFNKIHYYKVLSDLIYIYIDQSRFDSALHYNSILEKVARTTLDTNMLSNSYNAYGIIYALMKDYSQSLHYQFKDLELIKASGSTEFLDITYYNISEVYEKLGDFENALVYYKLQEHHRDSIQKEESKRNIESLKVQFDTEKKEQALLSLNQKNKLDQLENERKQGLLIVIILSLVVIATILGFLYYRNQSSKLKTELILKSEKQEIERKLLRTQMSPHFLTNSLGTVKNFMEKNNSKAASDYLDRFAIQMRKTLGYSRSENITLEEEIQLLENNLKLENYRLPSFSYSINVDEELDIDDIFIPPMLLQPFVENAVKYGIERSQNLNGIIEVNISSLGQNQAQVLILDNGNGLGKTKKSNESYSLDITVERINNHNKFQSKKILFSIEDRKDSKGVEVKFIFDL